MFFRKKVCSSTNSCFWLGYIFYVNVSVLNFRLILISRESYTLKSVPCMFFVAVIFCICLGDVYMYAKYNM